MRLEEFDYRLPADRVAQVPSARREEARLMILDRSNGATRETIVARIGEALRPGDLLVLNDTRVFPARLPGRKTTGGIVELLLVARDGVDGDDSSWTALPSSTRGLAPGARLRIADGFEAEFLGEAGPGRVRVRLVVSSGDVAAAIRRHGEVPLPPYIRRETSDPRSGVDRERYQTVYARAEGAIAAPTAGLHFTEPLLESLRAAGVETAMLTLHVGPGTFQPVRTPDIEDHRLEAEEFSLPAPTAEAVAACRARGGRIIAVGTTVVRVLEGRALPDGRVVPGTGRCGTYIVPGHRFKAVDALLTNFHLPRTSLLVLVAAFAGRERILKSYARALESGFRFYSYGDAMLIL